MSIVIRTGDDGTAAASTARFSNVWWFRKQFKATPEQTDGCSGLIFEGINCRADIWLNGARIATADETFSAFRICTMRLFRPVDCSFIKTSLSGKALTKNCKHQPTLVNNKVQLCIAQAGLVQPLLKPAFSP